MKNLFYKTAFLNFCNSLFPNKRDNVNRIILKSVFILGITGLVAFLLSVSVYFNKINNMQKLQNQNSQLYSQLLSEKQTALKTLKTQNSDFKAWINIENTSVSYPVYQTDNNNYYLSHNQLKKKSAFGSLFFDAKDSLSEKVTDRNLVIYGNSPKSDLLFSPLKNYKSLHFLKQNSYIDLITPGGNQKYVIFAVFVINSDPQDDGNRIFDYKKSEFETREEFDLWFSELTQRNLYENNIDVTSEDEFLTLVTDSGEFKGAKLVVAARKMRDGDNTQNFYIKPNKTPRYPNIYYTLKGIKNPFTNKEEDYVSQH